MANEVIALTTYAFFAARGASIDAVTVAREAKPDVSPEANWTDLGIVRSFSVADNSTTEVVQKGVPGHVVDYDVIKTADSRTFTLEMVEFNAVAVQAMFNSAVISTTFVPGGSGRHVQGWVKIQQYNQDDELVIAFDVWADITLPSAEIPLGGLASYSLDIRQLYSTLNTGNLSNL
jgi:hypothetical protein